MVQRAQATQKRATSSRPRQTDEDAISLLMQDHREVEKLFKEFEKIREDGEDDAKAEIVEKACEALTIHAEIEEEIFYPAVRKAIDEQELLDEAEVEHSTVKQLIEELEGMKPADDLYDAKFTVLGEYVKHHVKEEEGQIFPKAKKAKLDIDALGRRLRERKDHLQGTAAEDAA